MSFYFLFFFQNWEDISSLIVTKSHWHSFRTLIKRRKLFYKPELLRSFPVVVPLSRRQHFRFTERNSSTTERNSTGSYFLLDTNEKVRPVMTSIIRVYSNRGHKRIWMRKWNSSLIIISPTVVFTFRECKWDQAIRRIDHSHVKQTLLNLPSHSSFPLNGNVA